MAELPNRLVIDGVVYVRADEDLQETECAAQKCDYYRHYLCYHDPSVNGPKLEHAAYHHAADRCEEAQNAQIKWHQDHADNPNAVEPPHLEQQARYWENKICA